MSILSNILHPVKSLQKWALTRLIEGFVKELPDAKEKILKIWEQHKYEIFEKVKKAIQKVITDFIRSKMEKQTEPHPIQSNN